MSTINFAGLASGFDSSTLITQLVTQEKLPEQAMQQHQSDLTSQISTLGTLVTQLQALGSAAAAVGTAQDVQSLAATSSDSSTVGAVASTTATTGTYSVVVNSLAAAQTSVSSGFASDSAGVAGAGSLTITSGSGAPVTINYGASDTLDSIAASINSQLGSSLNASVINDGSQYRLLINATNTGKANAVSFSESGSGLGLAGSGSTLVAASDASFSVNGLALTRASNNVSDVVNGVALTLSGKTPAGSPTIVTVAPSTSDLQAKVQTLITAYNAAATTLHNQMDYQGTTLGADTLFGDSQIEGLQQTLSSMIVGAFSYGSGALNAASLGITTQPDNTLALDPTKFAQAVAADPSAVQHLLLGDGSTGSGLVGAINNVVTQYTQYGTGELLTEQTSKQGQISDYDTQIAQIELRASSLQDSLTSQFANLDSVESAFTNQESYLTALLNQKSSG